MRSTTHGISIDHDAKQFHRDYLDLLLLLNQVKRRENNFYANTIKGQISKQNQISMYSGIPNNE